MLRRTTASTKSQDGVQYRIYVNEFTVDYADDEDSDTPLQIEIRKGRKNPKRFHVKVSSKRKLKEVAVGSEADERAPRASDRSRASRSG
eukprot:5847272-Alexandrium_andersonii.AAC.1